MGWLVCTRIGEILSPKALPLLSVLLKTRIVGLLPLGVLNQVEALVLLELFLAGLQIGTKTREPDLMQVILHQHIKKSEPTGQCAHATDQGNAGIMGKGHKLRNIVIRQSLNTIPLFKR